MAEIRQSKVPVTNPGLVQAMEAMKQERTPKTELTFINHMKAARFLVPANIRQVQKAEANEDGTVVLKDVPEVQILLFNNKNGQKFLPLFTDPVEARKWEGFQDHQMFAFSFQDLCRFCETNKNETLEGVVVDPYGHNVIINVDTIQRMRETENIAPGTKVQIGDYKEEPKPLLDALLAHLPSEAGIVKAYLRVMKREDKPAPNFLLIVELDKSIITNSDELRAAFDKIAETAKPQLRGAELAIVPSDSNFGVAALRNAVPFYEK